MKLKDLSVKQFSTLWDILKDEHYQTEIDRTVDLLTTLTGKPESYYLSLSLDEFKRHSTALDFLTLDTIEGKPERFIKANGRVYAPQYDFGNRLTAGQVVDVLSFSKDPKKIIENLPKILASISLPTKRTLFRRTTKSYGSVDHAEVCKDMEEASIVDAYSIAVFFCDVWRTFLETTGDYLTKELLATKKKTNQELTESEKLGLVNILQVYGDGIIARKKSQ